VLEKLPVAGITNGLSDQNRPENLVELDHEYLAQLQARRGPDLPIFQNPTVQHEMLTEDHRFDLEQLHLKSVLKRLLHLEAFGEENFHNPILLTAVGRLVGQKNFGLIADVIEPVLAYDDNTKFIILASAPEGDSDGKATENAFFSLAARYPQRVYFNNTFNGPLSKMIFAGGDFTLIPSRFEPCGLVDYEASLLGTVVIGRLTGGLAKVRHCAYLYDWLDISDRWGEANAFFQQIKNAIDTFRHNPARHWALIQAAMSINASWDKSADQYIEMYRYGQLMKAWLQRRKKLVSDFIKTLGDEEALFAAFFDPADGAYSDQLNEALEAKLESLS
jgi:glycogen synthase